MGPSAHAALTAAIDALLPQTQCRQCGFEGCLPYAQALADGRAEINRCPPGGAAGIGALARLLGRAERPLDPSCGVPRPLRIARIDEARCIGCTLCIQACPVDAIVGTARAMHTVVAAECTGCDLCLAPCPVDCIDMVAPQPAREWTRADADGARARLHERQRRERDALRRQDENLLATARHKLEELDGRDDLARAEIERRRAIVAGALARAQARRAAESP
jgi:Na+-translocating ferredoxin:NAD+ oxidoreductase subunit B